MCGKATCIGALRVGSKAAMLLSVKGHAQSQLVVSVQLRAWRTIQQGETIDAHVVCMHATA